VETAIKSVLPSPDQSWHWPDLVKVHVPPRFPGDGSQNPTPVTAVTAPALFVAVSVNRVF
jgi:hypothetical protein